MKRLMNFRDRRGKLLGDPSADAAP